MPIINSIPLFTVLISPLEMITKSIAGLKAEIRIVFGFESNYSLNKLTTWRSAQIDKEKWRAILIMPPDGIRKNSKNKFRASSSITECIKLKEPFDKFWYSLSINLFLCKNEISAAKRNKAQV